jgi:hypothetical protein
MVEDGGWMGNGLLVKSRSGKEWCVENYKYLELFTCFEIELQQLRMPRALFIDVTALLLAVSEILLTRPQIYKSILMNS